MDNFSSTVSSEWRDWEIRDENEAMIGAEFIPLVPWFDTFQGWACLSYHIMRYFIASSILFSWRYYHPRGPANESSRFATWVAWIDKNEQFIPYLLTSEKYFHSTLGLDNQIRIDYSDQLVMNESTREKHMEKSNQKQWPRLDSIHNVNFTCLRQEFLDILVDRW